MKLCDATVLQRNGEFTLSTFFYTFLSLLLYLSILVLIGLFCVSVYVCVDADMKLKRFQRALHEMK